MQNSLSRAWSISVVSRFLAANPSPAVLVTDYDLGPIKGLDLIETARSVSPAVKCLLVSGTAEPVILAQYPVQADLFVAKPFRGEQLMGAVRQLLKM